MHAIRKGQVRWVAKGDPVGQRQFIHQSSGLPRSSCVDHPRYRAAHAICNRTGSGGAGLDRR
jgi:hypothetical protein